MCSGTDPINNSAREKWLRKKSSKCFLFIVVRLCLFSSRVDTLGASLENQCKVLRAGKRLFLSAVFSTAALCEFTGRFFACCIFAV